MLPDGTQTTLDTMFARLAVGCWERDGVSHLEFPYPLHWPLPLGPKGTRVYLFPLVDGLEKLSLGGLPYCRRGRASSGHSSLGGLGVRDLQHTGVTLLVQWLWLQKTNPTPPSWELHLSYGSEVMIVFRASTVWHVGDESSFRF